MAAGSHGDVGKEHLHEQRNGGEILPGNLCRGVRSDPIGADIFATCDKKQEIFIHGSGEASSGNLFALPIFQKI